MKYLLIPLLALLISCGSESNDPKAKTQESKTITIEDEGLMRQICKETNEMYSKNAIDSRARFPYEVNGKALDAGKVSDARYFMRKRLNKEGEESIKKKFNIDRSELSRILAKGSVNKWPESIQTD